MIYISEIKFSTKVARIMAFTLTKMRDTIITHVNKQSDKIQMFKEDSINKLVTYDCLKVCFSYPIIGIQRHLI